ncbi:MAG: carbamoyltransferase [Acidobacteria bacterium]|nr:carbamoyltransferase [Acidobacteriota bacterium]MBU4307206.1 carbamoyltransferase [Acidobacteriota bacterium]MCG2810117.1 carbamoyltransferase [Candidatus Aminicenantes bacterium]
MIMLILGISAFYHDSAVCLIDDGKLIFAAQEERFSRKKHDSEFPEKALKRCLEYCGITAVDLDGVVFYEKNFTKLDRLFSTYMQFAPAGIRSFLSAVPVWAKQKIFIKEIIREKLGRDDLPIYFTNHHEAHIASAFYPSPFQAAAVITVDGVGEWDTLTIARAAGSDFSILKRITFPHSLGLLYSAFTYFTGFKVNSGEYKLMGLAPYGEPVYRDLILQELIDVKDDGSFRLNLKYFNFHTGLTMTGKKFAKLFGVNRRKPETELRQVDMDLAASIQLVLEEIMEKIVRYAKAHIASDNLCLAGGVALNCVANGKILKKQIFKNIWIQPAAGDAGGALGAALYFWHKHLKNKRQANGDVSAQGGSFLGPHYSAAEIKAFLEEKQIKYQEFERAELCRTVAQLIADQKVIGFFQGRMEFGPRALGGRSIIGDARSAAMQSKMNLKIKFRESFRPFAPSMLEEFTGEYFDFHHPSPYMLLVYDINEKYRTPIAAEAGGKKGLAKLSVTRSTVPAITHVDYSARLHTVNRKTNPYYYDVISAFRQLTGCPVIINTSFNVRGEPIVESPADAYRCFSRTNMDYLVLENFLIEKKQQDFIDIDEDWMKEFPLD